MEISRFTGHWANLSVASSFRNQKVICPLSGRFHYVRKIQLERIGPSPVNGETINSFHNPLGYRELWKIVPLRLQDTPPPQTWIEEGRWRIERFPFVGVL